MLDQTPSKSMIEQHEIVHYLLFTKETYFLKTETNNNLKKHSSLQNSSFNHRFIFDKEHKCSARFTM